MKTIGIIQPNYIPWRGYFDFIKEVDVFVLLDDVQFTRRDWRTRNKVKLLDGSTRWLTVPVIGSRDQLIKDVKIDNTQEWRQKHLNTLQASYAKSPFFYEYFPELESIYLGDNHQLLANLNLDLINMLCGWLSINTPVLRASTFEVHGRKDERLIALVQAVDGDRYLSGPAAREYIQPTMWQHAGIEVAYKNYDGYPAYTQISEPYVGKVSILDLIFAVGRSAPDYIWGSKRL